MPPNLKRELRNIKARMQQPSRMPQGISDTEAIEWLQQQQNRLQKLQQNKLALIGRCHATSNQK